MLTEVRRECLFARFHRACYYLSQAYHIALTARERLRAANAPVEICILADNIVESYRRRLDELHAELERDFALS